MTRALIASLIVCVVSVAAAAQNSDEAARLQLLEDQVLELKTEIRRLKLVVAEMRTDITKLSAVKRHAGSATQAPEPKSECETRLEEMQVRHDQLRALGFKESHPDVSRLNGSIDKLRAACEAEER
jgi:predicted RNase H-like nuclease (RuvC/YqgF family)